MITARTDARFMHAAIALADRGIGVTTPNPSVGCLIVQGTRIVGRGWTQAGGRPHAEYVALRQAGSAARGSTLYTTLEPCAHVSARGPSCADEIIRAGVARVVIAVTDPDPRTKDQGKARLEAAGINVLSGVGERAASQGLHSHFIRTREARVSVTLKIATSLDGFMTDVDGISNWITGEPARQHVQMERARHDVIIVGAGTVRADNPKLDVRLPGLEHRSPVPIVISNSGKLLEGAHLTNNPKARSVVMVQPRSLLQELANEGFLSVMVEGGPTLAAQFINADVVDRLLWYRAPIFVGCGKSIADRIDAQALDAAHGRWRNAATHHFGNDTLSEFIRVREV
jgi:diaminohydroxyphosphoribosylaminopyrimidine deaminase / 5-amino-6-(5-phosphoribosylamino)uracil reductase